MLTTIFLCAFLATESLARIPFNANDTSSSSTKILLKRPGILIDSHYRFPSDKSFPSFDIENELTGISVKCFSARDYELLTGDIVKYGMARMMSSILFADSTRSIGLQELRISLGFAPLGPWKHMNYTRPREEELASAPSMKAYYELVEPASIHESISLDGMWFHEKTLTSAIAYLDERFPLIRFIFRRRFNEMRLENKLLIDRELIDRMRTEAERLEGKIMDAIRRMEEDKPRCEKIVK